MLSTTRTFLPTLLPTLYRPTTTSPLLRLRLYSTADRTSDRIPTNDPNPPAPAQNVSESNAVPTTSAGNFDAPIQEYPEDAERQRRMQAPNRARPWSRSQAERAQAMSGPRFEQTIMELQPQPFAAIELIHKQPVRWMKEAKASCDGGGGALGHPKIFINLDKPQICWCTYCGLPFAHEHHRKLLESQPSTSFPLDPVGDAAEVNESQRVSDEPFGQR